MEEANQLLRDAALAHKVVLEVEFDVAGEWVPAASSFPSRPISPPCSSHPASFRVCSVSPERWEKGTGRE